MTKLYYTIGEVADLFNVSTSLLRYWETQFKSLRPEKDRSGNRRFKVRDIEAVNEIYQLVKIRGFTLEGAKKQLSKSDAIPMETTVLDEVIQNLSALSERIKKLEDKADQAV